MREKGRMASVVLLMMLAIGALGQFQPTIPQSVNAASALQLSPPLNLVELGYGPSSLMPLSVGTPTFTVGDELWILTQFNSTVELFSPNSTTPQLNEAIEPDGAFLLFTFTSENTIDGNWSVAFSKSPSGAFSFLVQVINPANHTISASLNSYRFQGPELALSYSVSAPLNSIGVQGCLLPQSLSNVTTFSLPFSIGGVVEVANNGGILSINAVGNVSQQFEFWAELYTLYSYQVNGGYLSQYLEAASTNTTILSSQNTYANLAINPLVGMRSGIYELRGFLETGANLYVQQYPILISPQLPLQPALDAAWTSIASCQMTTMNGPSIVLTETLSNSSTLWPSRYLLSYMVGGVQLFSSNPLSLQIGEETLSDGDLGTPANIGIQVSANSAFSSVVVGESFFVASSETSIFSNVSLSYGGKVFSTMNIKPVLEFSALLPVVPALGEAIVLVNFNGNPIVNATLSLENDALNATVAKLSNSQGSAIFFGPAGNYSLSVSVNGQHTERNFSLTEGQSSSIIVSLSSGSGGGGSINAGDLEILVAASIIALIGIVANVWVWIRRPRRMMR